MKFKIGDFVKLNPKSHWATYLCGQLPQDLIAKIIEINKESLGYIVEWKIDGKAYSINYGENDLILVEDNIDQETLNKMTDEDDKQMEKVTPKSALEIQIDGQHYKNMKLQPIELVYKLGGTPSFCKVAKYTTRVKDEPLKQIDKAIHCVRLEQELNDYAESYYTYDKSKLHLIYEFTTNIYIATALVALAYFDYNTAIYALELLREEVECQK